MGTIRKIVGDQHTDPLNSATVINRPLEDVLSNSGYPTDGTTFYGFAAGLKGTGSPEGVVAASVSTLYTDTSATDGRGHWLKVKGTSTSVGWRRVKDKIDAGAFSIDPSGAVDSGGGFAAADAVAVAANVELSVPPGTYLIASATALAAHLTTQRGVTFIRGGSGALTVNGTIDAGRYKLFDPSLSGFLSFGKHRRFLGEWFGAVGDGTTADDPFLVFAGKSVPDDSTILFDAALQLTLYSEWATLARRGVKYRSTVPAFPDGNGCSVTWRGPTPIYGPDASLTNGSKIVTFTNPLTRVPNVGERFIVQGTGSNQLNSTVASVQSSTQITLADNAPMTIGPIAYTIGGVMISLLSCDHCEVSGFAIKPHPTNGILQRYDGYITSGSTTLNLAGAGILDGSFPTRAIRVVGAGPNGSDLVTTIASVTNGTQCILAAPASTTITSAQLTDVLVGPSATSLPALYGILLDLSGINGVTGTNCYVTDNLFLDNCNRQWWAVSMAPTTQNNHESHEIEHNSFHGGDNGIENLMDPVNTTSGSTVVNNPTANAITAGMIGKRVRIPGAGTLPLVGLSINAGSNTLSVGTLVTPYYVGQSITVHGAGVAGADLVTTIQTFLNPSQVQLAASAATAVVNQTGFVTGGLLDTKIISIQDNQHFVIRNAASVSVANRVPVVGEFRSYAITIGASFNAKKETICLNIMGNFLYNVWCKNGGFGAYSNQHEVSEAAYRIDGSSVPCTIDHDDHEGCLRFLDNDAAGYPVELSTIRLGSINMYPQGGHIRVGANGARQVTLRDCGFDTKPTQIEQTFLEMAGGDGELHVEDCFSPNPVTMSQVIDTAFVMSAGVTCKIESFNGVTDAPGETMVFTSNPAAKSGLYIQAETSTGNECHAVDALYVNNNTANGPTSAVRARYEIAAGAGNVEPCALDVGYGVTTISGGNNFDGANGSAMIVRLPTGGGNSWKCTVGGRQITAIHVTSPANVNSVTNPLVGLQIDQIGIAGVTTPRAIWQVGATDKNLLAGRTFQAAPATAPTDADLLNNTVSIYLDEAGNNLKVRVRKSDGTYKTATVALV